jgi:hypothetical protein
VTYNQTVVDAAEQVARAVQNDFFQLSGEGGVTLAAVAGAGKSHFVTNTVKKCRPRGIRVAVAAPTNEQVFSLVRSLAESDPKRPVAYVPAQGIELPAWARRPNVVSLQPAHQATGLPVVVGTIHKLASALHPRRRSIPALGAFDALVIDESFQANSASYYAVADIAPRHLCVGDSGQILPFSTIESGRQWKGLAEDPLQTAFGILHANHPGTPKHQFPITRRLDGRGAGIAKLFYPVDHTFGAAVADGVRTMTLAPSIAATARIKALDQALALAAQGGWAHLELPDRQTLIADPDTGRLIVDLLVRLRQRSARVRCERCTELAALAPERIAVAVAHNEQKAMLRAMLDHAGLNAIVANTANKLQGLEFDLVVCWHPLAGLAEIDEFHVEAGRMCVMCTRHRHACVVVGRRGDRQLVEELPPATPAYPGSGPEGDDVLRGWEVHREVFAALAPYRVPIDDDASN